MTDISFLGPTPLIRLKGLMARLRAPETGCPWDREQTFETIAPYTVEEAYEVREAIQNRDLPALKEELGDLLFQVVFHAQMAEEIGAFNLEDVCDALSEKMVRRHPHIFGGHTDDRTAEEQTQAWEEQKAQERTAKADKGKESLLDDVPFALPALMRAEKLQKRAARVGFDWPDVSGVMDKITEEAQELAEAIDDGSQIDCQEEMGDLLFTITNLARWLKVDPEEALRLTNTKFTTRFQAIETHAKKNQKPLSGFTLEEMETLWRKAKHKQLD